ESEKPILKIYDSVEDFEDPSFVGDSYVKTAPSNAKEQRAAHEKEKDAQQKFTPIPRPPTPYPQRLMKKAEDG
ncbi:hypothetical protein HAX54_012160, partial [Datura stramonium]|nr:hypothetical protein [Datura stramonium]